MGELERELIGAAQELQWPATPRFELPVALPRPRRRPLLVLASAVLAGLAIAFSVPGARSAILQTFHLEGVSIERVDVLPPAEERSLAATLGRRIDAAEARRLLGHRFVLPRVSGRATLHAEGDVVSVLLLDGEPVLLSESRNGAGSFILQKMVAGSTGVAGLQVRGAPGYWISGAEHLYLEPAAPPRLAGNVLIWAAGGTVYRLEARTLSRTQALALAKELAGT